MIVSEFIMIWKISDDLLNKKSLALEIYNIARIQMSMNSGAKNVIMIAQSFFDFRYLIFSKESVLGVKNEVIWYILNIIEINFNTGKSMVAYIMISN